jgi:tRNA pseudouridine38-40 synthase
MHGIVITQVGPMVHCHVKANAFVHHMVRKIVATLVAVGHGRMLVETVENILLEKNREAVPGQAPAKGLFLRAVGYSAEYRLPTEMKSQLLGGDKCLVMVEAVLSAQK